MTTSTWEVFSDAGNNFRWKLSSSQEFDIPTTPTSNESPSTPPLPSFEDPLLEECSLIVEDSASDSDEPYVRRTPITRSATRRSIWSTRSSSIGKTSAVLTPDFTGDVQTGGQCFNGNGFSSPNSMFQTGSGKTVNVSSAPFSGGQCFNGNGFSSPNSMFQTGSGKTVNVSSAGLLRAKALLGINDNDDLGTLDDFEPAKKKFNGNDKLSRDVVENAARSENNTLFTKVQFHSGNKSSRNELVHMAVGKSLPSEIFTSATDQMPPIKFHTAGGRSISVSSEALQRARSLLADLDMNGLSDEGDAGASMSSFFRNVNANVNSFDKENNTDSSLSHCQYDRMQQNPQKFVSPLCSSLKRKQLGAKSEVMCSGTNLISKFDAEASFYKSNGKTSSLNRPSFVKTVVPDTTIQLSASNGKGLGNNKLKRSPVGPLADVTNTVGVDSASKKGTTFELKRTVRRSYVSPFKMPRSLKFATPPKCNISSAPIGSLSEVSEASCSRKRVSTHYPCHLKRPYVKEYFNVPPALTIMDQLPDQVRLMNPGNSEKYMFYDGSQLIGVESFYQMLIQSGASSQHASKKWVANHYKWIVWKLASYERCYSAEFLTKFLTISNVLDELKYRYEREINQGQRSAVKRILEGDASPSSMMVLCVSAICSASDIGISDASGIVKGSTGRVQLSDGWYSIGAQLDGLLSKHLAVGKLFVGQKLRLCGASLNGWNGPLSPLEASSTACLLLHINGTYRAGWAERLGFCKGACPPLAFKCVKSNGGQIPRTLVGVTRIYPVLYKERSRSGRFIVRSEKMEAAVTQLYNQRRSNIIEGIVSDFQRGGNVSYIADDQNNEEGARILAMLESAAEPEFIMAEMSVEKLMCLSKYQAKLEARRQVDMQKAIEKALEDAGLHAREVSPFMRVRVVGLTSKGQKESKDSKEGLMRIWNPTEKQKLELAEGKAYVVSGLIPLSSDPNTLQLEAKGSSSNWQPLTKNEKESFVPFFCPRKSVLLARMGDVPISSEFETVGLVVHVGLEFIAGLQKKQWVFVTDGSICKSVTEASTVSMLAIGFYSPSTEDDSISPFNNNLVGSIVGFCNLVKRARDDMNQMWVADATENATYHLNYDNPLRPHLKHAFASLKIWQQNSSLMIEKLRQRILYILGSSQG